MKNNLRIQRVSTPQAVQWAIVLSALLPLNLLASVHYVNAANKRPSAPYTNWVTAATNIQAAVDVAISGDSILVTNGYYTSSGRTVAEVGELSSLAVTKPLTIQSVRGPLFTTIGGNGSMRCVYLMNGALMSGFTLTGGRVQSNGAGAYGGTLTNCILRDNYAGYGSLRSSLGPGGAGGGAFSCTLNSCVLTSNTVDGRGGGASGCTLNNCVLSSNSAPMVVIRLPYEVFYGSGGGTFNSTLNNCTLTGNSASWAGGAYQCGLTNCIVLNSSGGNYDSCSLSHCCTTPLPSGEDNISGPPLFVNEAASNLRLQSNSPCINSGNNASAPIGTDPDGNPRVAGGTVDIGAYEFQSPQSVVSYAWLQQYGFATDGSADYADPDGDHFDNYREWRAGTSPLDASSVLKMLGVSNDNDRLTVTWQSVPSRAYFLERSTDLTQPSAFTTIATHIAGQADFTSYTDVTAVGNGPFFYRVRVR